MKIETERTLIEILSSDDAELLLKYYLDNKQHLQPWEPKRNKDFYTLKHFSELLKNNQKNFLDKKELRFAALCKDRKEVIAISNFTNVIQSPFQACYLGYSIAESHQGQGIMTEVLKATIDFVFKELNLHRIMANYIPRNEKSAAVLKKLGFKREGFAKSYLKIAGQWEDHILTSKINPSHLWTSE